MENVCEHIYQQNDPPKYPMEVLLKFATGDTFEIKANVQFAFISKSK